MKWLISHTGNLVPAVLQVTGIVVLLASVAFWMITGNQSVLMVSASLSLIGVGSYTNQVHKLRNIVAHEQESAT